MSRSLPRVASLSWVLLALFLVHACAAPPNKEIADAQNAIKAAQAAGAEKHAREPYAAATEAYRLANEAVLAGDYRLALDRALESRDHAQLATRQASDLNIRARDQAHQAMADVAESLANTALRIETADRAGAPRRVIVDARRTLTQASTDVQEASAALKKEEFANAVRILSGVKPRLDKTVASLKAATPQSSKRRP